MIFDIKMDFTCKARFVARGHVIDEHKTTMKIEVRKTMNYEDYESILYSWIFVGTVGL
jgi:hypothetical protein